MPSFPPLRRAAVVIVALACVALAAWGGWRGYRRLVGEPSAALARTWFAGRRVVDRDGRLLRELPSVSGLRGRPLPLAELGDRVQVATLASEDKRFYEHDGVDGRAVARAVVQNATHARVVSGASTITQQLVKLLDGDGEPRPRSLAAKILEAARAQNLEASLSKETIFEAYLNRLSYGRGLVGPEAAARGYFGVASRDLSWAQAAFLAVLPRAPAFLDPLAHRERALLRQQALLQAMAEAGLLGSADLARALAEPITVRAPARPFDAPHLVERLTQDGLLDASGVTRATIDSELQRDVEGLTQTHLATIAERSARDAAVLVIDNATGDVLAYLGSADFHAADIDGQVDMIRARRQPGSTLKPFVYALAFARGHDAAELVADVPTTFSESTGSYAPKNFDNGFEGPISLREALAGSLNIPAIRVASELGADAVLTTLHDFGFDSLDGSADRYGLAIALGSGEVTLAELAGAYVALARGGDAIPLRFVLRGSPSGRRVVDPEIAASITEILSDPLARVRGLHGQGPFDIGFPIAVKTGTSSGYRDSVTIGYTRERTVAVWVGNADGSPMHELTGASGAGPLFADVLRRAMRDVPSRAPLWEPALLESAEVCPLSGKRPGPSCSDHATRWFARGHAPRESCDLHVRATKRAAATAEPPFRCDPRGASRIVLLPSAFDAWLATQPLGAPGQDPFGLPWFGRSRVPGCSEHADPEARATPVRIVSPKPGAVFERDRAAPSDQQAIVVDVAWTPTDEAPTPDPIELVLDGRVITRWPSPRASQRARIDVVSGDHELVARAANPRLALAEVLVRFSVR